MRNDSCTRRPMAPEDTATAFLWRTTSTYAPTSPWYAIRCSNADARRRLPHTYSPLRLPMLSPSLLTRCFVWLRHLPHRRGYGIHSPWAFSLVRGVIYERCRYYAYEGLHFIYKERRRNIAERDLRLLFRLTNERQPRHAVVTGEERDVVREYLLAACPRMQIYERIGDCPQLDLWIDSSPAWTATFPAALTAAHDRTLFVLARIDRHPEAWQSLRRLPQVRVTFDLYHLGLAYFESRLNKQDYRINYAF